MAAAAPSQTATPKAAPTLKHRGFTETPSGSDAGNVKKREFRAAPLAGATGTADRGRAGDSPRSAAKTPQPKVEASVAFEAVDYEHASPGKSRVFISGSAKPGAKLFIYIDNEPVGQADAKEDGRWVFSGPITLRSGAHRMRADQVTGGDRVVARAEVTFERLTTAALAELDPKSEAVKEPARTTASPEPPAPPKAAGEGASTKVARAAPGTAQPPAPPTAAGEGASTDVARAAPVAAQPAPKAKAAPRTARKPIRRRRVRRSRSMVVVRRGDSLWRISRRIYGRGARYTTIYRRNKNQIRDPNLIYPRQRLRVKGR